MDSTTGLLGYCQPLSTTGGAPVVLKIASNGPERRAVEVLRVARGDVGPNGPCAAFEPRDWGGARDMALTRIETVGGSCAVARQAPDTSDIAGLALS